MCPLTHYIKVDIYYDNYSYKYFRYIVYIVALTLGYESALVSAFLRLTCKSIF